ncbi:unnamed protein product [Colias eurytheme]|nr:unnamed protein product [Colias eurytheme]
MKNSSNAPQFVANYAQERSGRKSSAQTWETTENVIEEGFSVRRGGARTHGAWSAGSARQAHSSWMLRRPHLSRDPTQAATPRAMFAIAIL